MKYLSILIFSILLVGCAHKTPSHQEAVKSVDNVPFKVPNKWENIKDNGHTNLNWVDTFNDKTLNLLIQEALKNNKNIQAYQAQVEQANTLVNLAASALKPTIGLGGKYNSRNNKGLTELYGTGMSADWELDVWGRIALSVSAAKESALATQSDYEYARQSLIASTAKAWFMTNSSYLQMQHSKQIIALFKKELKIMHTKHEIGQVEQQQILLAQNKLSNAQEAYSKSQEAYSQAQRSLEVLLGRYPAGLIKPKKSLNVLPNHFPSAGVPSQLLERRPDLIAAEQRVAAAFYKQRESELLHLPEVSISIRGLVNNIADATTDFASNIFLPLYTGGAIESEIENATAIQKQRIAEYGQIALEAYKEVENNLILEQSLTQQQVYLSQVVKNNERSVQLVQISNEIGKAQYKEVLETKNNLISSKISLLDIQTQQLFNRVNLYLSLGGDFKEKKAEN